MNEPGEVLRVEIRDRKDFALLDRYTILATEQRELASVERTSNVCTSTQLSELDHSSFDPRPNAVEVGNVRSTRPVPIFCIWDLIVDLFACTREVLG
jgi:hypothetical protein